MHEMYSFARLSETLRNCSIQYFFTNKSPPPKNKIPNLVKNITRFNFRTVLVSIYKFTQAKNLLECQALLVDRWSWFHIPRRPTEVIHSFPCLLLENKDTIYFLSYNFNNKSVDLSECNFFNMLNLIKCILQKYIFRYLWSLQKSSWKWLLRFSFACTQEVRELSEYNLFI